MEETHAHPTRKHRRIHRRISVLVVVALLAGALLVPVALATVHNYWWQRNLGANTATSDFVNHNHVFNSLNFGPGATYPSGIYEYTPAGDKHYALNGNGNIQLDHPGTYYTHPYCWNRDSTSHFVSYCTANY